MRNKAQIFNIARNAKYNPFIGLLRLLLAIYVLLFHAIPRYAFYEHDVGSLWTLQSALIKIFNDADQTNAAVIAFIVISGYCIHRNGLRTNYQDVKKFYIKRCWRIFPMLFIGTLLGCVIFLNLQHDPNIHVISNTKQITLTAFIYKMSGLFAFIPYKFEQFVHLGNGPLLTCILECWLYLLYPVGMWVIQTKGNRYFWSVLSIMLFVGAILCNKIMPQASWWNNGCIISFLFYWWLGVYALSENNKIYKYKTWLLLGFWIATLILINHPGLYLLVEIKKILFALIISFLLRWSERLTKFKFPQELSASSFSIYVLHMPLLCLALYYDVNLFGAILLIIAGSYICYLCIEKPIMRHSIRNTDQIAVLS